MPVWAIVALVLGVPPVIGVILGVSLETILDDRWRMEQQEDCVRWYLLLARDKLPRFSLPRTTPATRRWSGWGPWDYVNKHWDAKGIDRFNPVHRASGMGVDKEYYLTHGGVRLARFEHRPAGQGFFLLNGDGFGNNRRREHLQAFIRDTLQARGQFRFGRVVVIPYRALDGAGIIPSTIWPLEILGPANVVMVEKMFSIEQMKALSKLCTKLPGTSDTILHPDQVPPILRKRGAVTIGGVNIVLSRRDGSTVFALAFEFEHRTVAVQLDTVPGRGFNLVSSSLLFQPPNGVETFFPLGPDGTISYETHRLGSTIFTARGPDGKRHRYISAFDEQDVDNYFLAQLPDKSKARTYADALHDLAPPIVHRAREEGRRVHRQGDVFFIETNHESDYIYGNAESRVRRAVALQSHARFTGRSPRGVRYHNDSSLYITENPITSEVSEEVSYKCRACGTTHHLQVYNGEQARNALSIYGTGHTADEVVVRKGDGATFVRGTVYHDPFLETPGRESEHREVFLRPEGKWFLCVRNTVPDQ